MSERGRREGGAGEMELSAFISAFLKQRGRMGKGKAGEEINGLAKERVSYMGIRMDKSRTCRWGSEVRRSLQKRDDMILFSLYPHRHLAPTATNILQRGNPRWLCLESPGARLTWIKRGGEGRGG